MQSEQDRLDELYGREMRNFGLVISDKCEELYGPYGQYCSDEQMAHVNEIVSAYTADEFAAALAEAEALTWSPDDLNTANKRVTQRQLQGRGAVA
jgi:hypothetical protein